jgi:hypothetical protein
MSKPSRRPTREARKEHKAKQQAAQRELHRRQAEAGLSPPTPASANVSNYLCNWKTGEEEQAGREEACLVSGLTLHIRCVGTEQQTSCAGDTCKAV